jgi:hypothetical protein
VQSEDETAAARATRRASAETPGALEQANLVKIRRSLASEATPLLTKGLASYRSDESPRSAATVTAAAQELSCSAEAVVLVTVAAAEQQQQGYLPGE